MRTPHPYIVLLPHTRTNDTDKHLVVHVKEWVAVLLGEKNEYTFTSSHDGYESAAAERNRLNHQPGDLPTCPTTITTHARKRGVSLTRATA